MKIDIGCKTFYYWFFIYLFTFASDTWVHITLVKGTQGHRNAYIQRVTG